MAPAVRTSEGNGLTRECCAPNDRFRDSAALDFSMSRATGGVQTKHQTTCLEARGCRGYTPSETQHIGCSAALPGWVLPVAKGSRSPRARSSMAPGASPAPCVALLGFSSLLDAALPREPPSATSSPASQGWLVDPRGDPAHPLPAHDTAERQELRQMPEMSFPSPVRALLQPRWRGSGREQLRAGSPLAGCLHRNECHPRF